MTNKSLITLFNYANLMALIIVLLINTSNMKVNSMPTSTQQNEILIDPLIKFMQACSTEYQTVTDKNIAKHQVEYKRCYETAYNTAKTAMDSSFYAKFVNPVRALFKHTKPSSKLNTCMFEFMHTYGCEDAIKRNAEKHINTMNIESSTSKLELENCFIAKKNECIDIDNKNKLENGGDLVNKDDPKTQVTMYGGTLKVSDIYAILVRKYIYS
eukprot:Pgem_evm1s4913